MRTMSFARNPVDLRDSRSQRVQRGELAVRAVAPQRVLAGLRRGVERREELHGRAAVRVHEGLERAPELGPRDLLQPL